MNYSFVQNSACEFFPCHETDSPEDFNFLFCFCPLYHLGSDCGGTIGYSEKGHKDCSGCLLPHNKDSYSLITNRLKADI